MDLQHELNFQVSKDQLLKAPATLIKFLKNPIQGVKSTPDWNWLTIAILNGIVAAAAGLIAGVVLRSISMIFLNLLFLPLSNIFINAIFSAFFYYSFLFFFKIQCDIKKIYILIFLANIPLLLLSTVSPIVPPMTIVGLAVSGMLLLVGFTENFKLPKKPLGKFILGLFAIYLVFWVWNSISTPDHHEAFRDIATPESLDILEKELEK